MQWLLHAPLPAQMLIDLGHKAHLPEELSLPVGATPQDVLTAAHAKQWDVISTDAELAKSALSRQTPFNRCMVYLQLSGGVEELREGVNRLFSRYPRLTPQRLYTVTASRVKVRQLPRSGSGI
jgi:hypothetical protein